MDLLQAIIFSGIIGALVGAAIGGISSYLISRWQLSKATDAARGAGRIVYLEIAQNIYSLNASQQMRPVRLMVSRRAWDAHFGDIAALLDEPVIAQVAAPYLQLELYSELFKQGPLEMFALGLHGQDREVIGRLTLAFREAEAALRPHVWTGKRRTGLQETIAKIPTPPSANKWQRFLGALASLPMWPFMLVIVLLQTASFVERLVHPTRKNRN
jgi:hypothetical protein